MKNKQQLIQRIDTLRKQVDGIGNDLTEIRQLAQGLEPEKQETPEGFVHFFTKDDATPKRGTEKPAIEMPEKTGGKEAQPAPKVATPAAETIQPIPVAQAAKPTAIPVPKPRNVPPPVHKIKTPNPPKMPKRNYRPANLEKFIGENLINKIGIGILVLGIAFFVKYAIDQNWIGNGPRVLTGLLSGGILIGIAHYLRKKMKAFSSVLVGGGLALFYFTVSIAFHEYALISQEIAFVSMIAISGLSVFLAISYDRMELAILSLLGGFATPFMVSTGSGNYQVLFTYISILNLGMLVLAYFKKWNVLNIISYVGTILLYGGWLLIEVIGNENAPYLGALIFGSIFYITFFYMNVINNVRQKRKFGGFEFGLLLSNTSLFYAAGMVILNSLGNGQYQGLFTAIMAVVNFGFAYPLYLRKDVDRNLVFLLIGLVLSFISLAAPVQLEGNYITLFWAVEAVLLLWLSQKSGIHLMKVGSIVLMGLLFISLVMDWMQIYLTGGDAMMLFINKGFTTGIVVMGALFAIKKLLANETGPQLIGEISLKYYTVFITLSLAAVAYFTGLFELLHQTEHSALTGHGVSLVIFSYHALIALTLALYARMKDLPTLGVVSAVTGFLTIGGYIVLNESAHIALRNNYIANLGGIGEFLFHYANLALVVALAVVVGKQIRKLFGWRTENGKAALWVMALITVFIASAELDHLMVFANINPTTTVQSILPQVHKIGYPILWGALSFGMMAIGMRYKFKTIRVMALGLFAITLAKLFIFDIRGVSEGGKIAAFISLGVLLLVISFLYQKLKNLLFDEDTQTKTGEGVA